MTLAVKPRRTHSIDPFFSLMDEFFPFAAKSDQAMNTTVAANVIESENHYVIELAVPGFTKEDFEISVEDDRLKIALDLKDKASEVKFKRREFNYGNFQRVWNLGDEIDQEKIEAHYESGILKIKLSKKVEAQKPVPKQIEIS